MKFNIIHVFHETILLHQDVITYKAHMGTAWDAYQRTCTTIHETYHLCTVVSFYFTRGRAFNFTASKRMKKVTGCVIYICLQRHTLFICFRRWQIMKSTKQRDLCWPREDWCPEWQRMAERQKQKTSDEVGRRVRGSQLAPDSHLWIAN